VDKKTKYPVYLVGKKHGNVTKCKSITEQKDYQRHFGTDYLEVDHYPTAEEIRKLLDKNMGEA
jgi:hypothetical protein